jgi:branched-chain amino acid transport system substrate-binding protein
MAILNLSWGRSVASAAVLSLVVIGATLPVEAAASAASNSPIAIGTVNDVTGPQAAVYGDTNKTLQAWADWTNANGGVDGHPVKLIAMDDQFNPATAISDVHELVQEDHVVAVVGEQSSYDDDFSSYLQKRGIPLVGNGLYDTALDSDSDLFPEGTTVLAGTYNEVALGAREGFKKTAILYCAESPACVANVALWKKDGKNLGVSLVYTASVAAGSPNFTAPCLGAKDADAQYYTIVDSTAVALRIAAACQAQGFNAPQVSFGLGVSSGLAAPSEDGLLASQPDVPYFDSASPAVTTMDAALNKYTPGVVGSSEFGESQVYAWASGLLFDEAAKAAHFSGNLTSAELVAGLYSLRGTTLDGMSPPLTYVKNQGHSISCSFVMGIKGGKFDLPQGTKLLCAPKAYS